MTYTAPSARAFREKAGTLSEKTTYELGLIDTQLDTHTTAIDLHKSKFVDLTASMVSATSLAANGADLASGTDAIYYGVFVPPVNITAVKMYYFLTEAYAKDTEDAVIAIKTEADEPVTIFTKTLTAAGEAVKTFGNDTPETSAADIAAGTPLNLCITATTETSGTGHAKVFMEYIER